MMRTYVTISVYHPAGCCLACSGVCCCKCCIALPIIGAIVRRRLPSNPAGERANGRREERCARHHLEARQCKTRNSQYVVIVSKTLLCLDFPAFLRVGYVATRGGTWQTQREGHGTRRS